MPALNFTMFVDKVEDGRKRQTIRAKRKHPIKETDMLYFYTGMRTKHCRLLGTAECTEVHDITIERFGPRKPTAGDIFIVGIDGLLLSDAEMDALAKADGFGSQEDFGAFFAPFSGHKNAFSGDLIYWGQEVTR